MTEQERAARLAGAILEEQIKGERAWYYLSFADGDLPEGQQFLGAVVVEGFGLATAIKQAHNLGINPGGSVAGGRWPVERVPLPAEGFRNRLLTKAEAENL